MNKWIAAGLSLAYFVFTSGLVFELSTVQGISNVDTPYSFAMSGEDTGIVGVFTEDDIKCAQWLADDSETPIATDINGLLLLDSTVVDLDRLIYRKGKEKRDIHLSDIDYYESCYIFITSWNTRHQIYIEGGQLGAGLRISNPLPKFDYKEAYRSGQSLVYLKELQ